MCKQKYIRKSLSVYIIDIVNVRKRRGCVLLLLLLCICFVSLLLLRLRPPCTLSVTSGFSAHIFIRLKTPSHSLSTICVEKFSAFHRMQFFFFDGSIVYVYDMLSSLPSSTVPYYTFANLIHNAEKSRRHTFVERLFYDYCFLVQLSWICFSTTSLSLSLCFRSLFTQWTIYDVREHIFITSSKAKVLCTIHRPLIRSFDTHIISKYNVIVVSQ